MDQQLYGILPVEYAYIELLALEATDVEEILDLAEFMEWGTPIPMQVTLEDQGQQRALPLEEITAVASERLLSNRQVDPSFITREQTVKALTTGIIRALNRDQELPLLSPDTFKSFVKLIIEDGAIDALEQEWMEVIIPNAIASNRLHEIIIAKQKSQHTRDSEK